MAVGTIEYHTLEDTTILDALYMTVTTISTVGFGEVHPLCDRGRAFTIGLILFGVSTMARAAESLVEASYNALVVISAKGLNPRLQVVACASSRETEKKLLRAGKTVSLQSLHRTRSVGSVWLWGFSSPQ